MKTLILAGGYGTRLGEETDKRPKPMVEIGGKPILWHIMKIYSYYGFNDFVVLLGYKGFMIKEYFYHFFLHQSAVTIDLSTNKMEIHKTVSEPWKITLLDTGQHTMTGGRILQAKPYVDQESFMLTYGDTLMDIDVKKLMEFHQSHGNYATMTVAQPRGQYGTVDISNTGRITKFQEKNKDQIGWINAGFFVCKSEIFNYLKNGDDTIFESEPLEKLARDGELHAYKHHGFYKCMDTLRDKTLLNSLCDNKQAKWKIWE